MPNVIRGIRVKVGEFAHRQDLANFDVVKATPLFRQLSQQGWRLADASGNDDEVAIMKVLQSIGRAATFASV